MTIMSYILDGQFFIDDFLSVLVPEATDTFKSVGIIVASLVVISLAIVLAVTLAFVVASIFAPPANNDFGIIGGPLVLYLGALLAPIGALWSAIRRAFAQIGQFILQNAIPIAITLAIAVVAFFWTAYYPVIIGSLIRVYETILVPFYRGVPLYALLAVELFIEWIHSTFINALVIRIPSAFVSGILFDLSTCATDTWSALFTQAITCAITFVEAWEVWGTSGTNMLTVPPDFGPFGASIGNLIGVIQIFFTCVCSGLGYFTAPIFGVFTEGTPNVPETTTQFACVVNSTINLPFAIVTDTVRPIYLFSTAINDGETFIDAIRGWDASYNLSFDTTRNLINCTLGVGDNLIQ